MSTHNILFLILKENHTKYPKYNNVCSNGIFMLGTQERVEIAVVNEPTVSEPLKLYCSSKLPRSL